MNFVFPESQDFIATYAKVFVCFLVSCHVYLLHWTWIGVLFRVSMPEVSVPLDDESSRWNIRIYQELVVYGHLFSKLHVKGLQEFMSSTFQSVQVFACSRFRPASNDGDVATFARAIVFLCRFNVRRGPPKRLSADRTYKRHLSALAGHRAEVFLGFHSGRRAPDHFPAGDTFDLLTSPSSAHVRLSKPLAILGSLPLVMAFFRAIMCHIATSFNVTCSAPSTHKGATRIAFFRSRRPWGELLAARATVLGLVWHVTMLSNMG